MASARSEFNRRALAMLRETAGDLDGMRQARARWSPVPLRKNLRLVFEPAEGARMDDAVAVTLVMCAPGGRRFGMLASAGVPAELGQRARGLGVRFVPVPGGCAA